MSEKNNLDILKMDFETAFAALQENVAQLENEDLPLEEGLARFERGQALAKHCAALLEQAELKVRQLAVDESQPLENEV
jgi:exodeoxyribonuclease VII small subunit